MQLNDKVLLGRLYERTYAAADNVWQLFVQDGGEKPSGGPGTRRSYQNDRGARARPKATSGPEKAKKQPLPFDDPLTDIFA